MSDILKIEHELGQLIKFDPVFHSLNLAMKRDFPNARDYICQLSSKDKNH